MRKHIAEPATAEQIARTIGVTEEDREVIRRVLSRQRGLRGRLIEPTLAPKSCDEPPVQPPPRLADQAPRPGSKRTK